MPTMSETQTTATAVSTQTSVVPGTEPLSATVQTGNELVSYQDSPPEIKAEVDQVMSEISLEDRSSILFFGSAAQEDMSTISENMLEGVRNKDLGTASNSLNEMVVAIRGFDIDELNPNRKLGFFERLFGKAKPIAEFMSKYEDVKSQITSITDNLEGHKTALLTDIISLDKLYEANLAYFKKLELYITAGEEKLRAIGESEIPALEEKTLADKDNMILAQSLRDLRSASDDLERRIHDLRLTRQVAMQSLPSIRLVQENDKSLINKINSTLINTVPLWKNQLAQAVTIFRMSDAADSLKKATDLTNDLLESNATNLRQGNAEVRRQIERGVFDIDSVKKANQELIATINDSLQIAEDGRQARGKALKELQTMESELQSTLVSAKARTQA